MNTMGRITLTIVLLLSGCAIGPDKLGIGGRHQSDPFQNGPLGNQPETPEYSTNSIELWVGWQDNTSTSLHRWYGELACAYHLDRSRAVEDYLNCTARAGLYWDLKKNKR